MHKKATQNNNESIHSKLWTLCAKHKKHCLDRYIFCCQHVVMSHNWGKEKISLYHILGGMTYETRNDLKNADKESIRVAKRKHEVTATGARTHRKKKVYKHSHGEGVVPAYAAGEEDL